MDLEIKRSENFNSPHLKFFEIKKKNFFNQSLQGKSANIIPKRNFVYSKKKIPQQNPKEIFRASIFEKNIFYP